jgi:hypothetical protein
MYAKNSVYSDAIYDVTNINTTTDVVRTNANVSFIAGDTFKIGGTVGNLSANTIYYIKTVAIYVTVQSINTTSDVVTTSANHYFYVGQPLTIVGTVGNATTGDTYYVRSIPAANTLTLTTDPKTNPLFNFTSTSIGGSFSAENAFTVSTTNGGATFDFTSSTVSSGQIIQLNAQPITCLFAEFGQAATKSVTIYTPISLSFVKLIFNIGSFNLKADSYYYVNLQPGTTGADGTVDILGKQIEYNASYSGLRDLDAFNTDTSAADGSGSNSVTTYDFIPYIALRDVI